MGNLHAAEFANALRRGDLTLDTVLSWHLTANHFPPVPLTLIPTCTEAIAAVAVDDGARAIDMPEGFPRSSMTAAEIVEGLHLSEYVAVAYEAASGVDHA